MAVGYAKVQKVTDKKRGYTTYTIVIPKNIVEIEKLNKGQLVEIDIKNPYKQVNSATH